jgi:hypothetical protein
MPSSNNHGKKGKWAGEIDLTAKLALTESQIAEITALKYLESGDSVQTTFGYQGKSWVAVQVDMDSNSSITHDQRQKFGLQYIYGGKTHPTPLAPYVYKYIKSANGVEFRFISYNRETIGKHECCKWQLQIGIEGQYPDAKDEDLYDKILEYLNNMLNTLKSSAKCNPPRTSPTKPATFTVIAKRTTHPEPEPSSVLESLRLNTLNASHTKPATSTVIAKRTTHPEPEPSSVLESLSLNTLNASHTKPATSTVIAKRTTHPEPEPSSVLESLSLNTLNASHTKPATSTVITKRILPSDSELKSFENCPRQFKISRRVIDLATEGNESMNVQRRHVIDLTTSPTSSP